MTASIIEFDAWAVVELMGHVAHAGRLSEEERFGVKLGRLDIPDEAGGFTTIYFGGSSVYRLTVVSEDVARAKARATQPRPVSAYEMRAIEPPKAIRREPELFEDYIDRIEREEDEEDEDSRDMDL